MSLPPEWKDKIDISTPFSWYKSFDNDDDDMYVSPSISPFSSSWCFV